MNRTTDDDADSTTMVTSIRVSRGIHREAKAYAAMRGMPFRTLVERALREYMDGHGDGTQTVVM